MNGMDAGTRDQIKTRVESRLAALDGVPSAWRPSLVLAMSWLIHKERDPDYGHRDAQGEATRLAPRAEHALSSNKIRKGMKFVSGAYPDGAGSTKKHAEPRLLAVLMALEDSHPFDIVERIEMTGPGGGDKKGDPNARQ